MLKEEISMDNFAATKGGHEFLYGTMPTLARNIKDLTAAVKELTAAVRVPAKTEDFSINDFCGTVVDEFEDYCDIVGITIDNPDREDDDDNAAVIYGEDYDRITAPVEELLSKKAPKYEKAEILEAAKAAVAAFKEIVNERGNKTDIHPNFLTKQVYSAFAVWNLVA